MTPPSVAMSKFKLLQEVGNQILICFLKHIQQPQQKVYTLQQQIVQNLSKQWKTGNMPSNYIIGFSIFQEVLNNKDVFGCLFDQIRIILGVKTETTDNTVKLEFDLSEEGTSSEDEAFPNFYEFESSKKNIEGQSLEETQCSSIKMYLNDSTTFLSEDLHLQLTEEQQLNNDLINDENEEIREYLNKLSKSTSELTHLSQHMRWSQPVSKGQRSQINNALYSCLVSVTIVINNKTINIIGHCAGAISKKQARRIGALFVLRKIYNKLPGVWLKFKALREHNQILQQPLNANNQQIFKKANLDVLDIPFFKQEKKNQQNDLESKRVKAYLDTLASYKAQIYLLTGKCKQISPPNMIREKQNEMGLWPVSATLNDGYEVFKIECKETSKKKAEEQCSRELLQLIYRRDIRRWQEFLEYKKVKNL